MDFTQRMMDRHRSGKPKLQSVQEDSERLSEEVRHNIVTTTASANGHFQTSCVNNKVMIETTVSWSKLPPERPIHPVIEVVSDGTSSTESSDEKENEKPGKSNFHPHKHNLQQLGAMYSDDHNVNVVQRAEDHFTTEEPRCNRTTHTRKPCDRSARLAALADTINHWEDDTRHFTSGKEAQGFSRSVSNQRLIYSYNKQENEKPTLPVKPQTHLKVPTPKKMPSPVKSSLHNATTASEISALPADKRLDSPIEIGTSNKVASSSDEEGSVPVKGVKQLRTVFNSHISDSVANQTEATNPTKQTRDPAELPLAERMALFERKAGQPVLPKASFTTQGPPSRLHNKLSETERKPILNTRSQPLNADIIGAAGSFQDRLALFEKGSSDKSSAKETSLGRQGELAVLKQRWNKNKEVVAPLKPLAPPSPPPLPSPPVPFEYGHSRCSRYSYKSEEDEDSDEPEGADPLMKEEKKVRFMPINPDHLYPNFTDGGSELESLDSGQENSDSYRSLSSTSSIESDGRKCELDYVNLSKSSLKRDWSTSESSGVEGNGIDDIVQEALDFSSNEGSPPKRLSYSYAMRDDARICLQEFSPTRREHFVSSSQPLTHTVSFYRKQQNLPLKVTTTIEVQPIYPEENYHRDDEMDEKLVKQKTDHLEQEVEKQETYISQAGHALDLCYSTFEFSGSTELLEAEKLLLLATHRRQALLQEIQRLKTEVRLLRGEPDTTERGSLSISHISLPLRMDVVHDAAKDDECYYLLCLVRHEEEVLCSDIMSARRSLHSGNKITFPNQFTVKDLYDDFKITVELYAMKARHKELIPHDIKYHINTNKKEVSKLRLTPHKSKKDPKLITQSPSTARTSAFTLAGYVDLSLREIHRSQFTLSKSKSVYKNVVEGSLQLRLETEMRVDMEYRGFLTMFEDVSGLGAWHRRWCLLKGSKLSYWRYPDDEQKKIPLDTIDLSQCSIREAEVISRDVCARPNTLQLFTVRPMRHTDSESLVLTVRGDRTCVRHWLSADTREERDQWCHHLNKALALMRSWGVSTAL